MVALIGAIGAAFLIRTYAAPTKYTFTANFTAPTSTWPTGILADSMMQTKGYYLLNYYPDNNKYGPIFRVHAEASGLGANRQAHGNVFCSQAEPVIKFVNNGPVTGSWEYVQPSAPVLLSAPLNGTPGGMFANGTSDTDIYVYSAEKSLDPTKPLKCVAQVYVTEKSKSTWRIVDVPVTQEFELAPSVL